MTAKHQTPIVSVDVVLLTLKEGMLFTALALRDKEPFEGKWALPGGYIHVDEDQDDVDAAARILLAKAGLQSPYFEQLGTFAGRDRDPRGWSVAIAHYALVPFEQLAHVEHDHLKWVPADGLRSLPFDHLKILQTALARVRSKTLYSSLPLYLMPELFTLTELQKVYEGVLGAGLDKHGFRRRIKELDILVEVTGAMSTGVGHRPAQQYRLKRKSQLVTSDSNLGVKAGS